MCNETLAKFSKVEFRNRLLFAITVIALMPVLFSLWPQNPSIPESSTSVDTFIPKGFVLIPIELSNYGFGLCSRTICLWAFFKRRSGAARAPDRTPCAPPLAPQNPSRFAVLVPETESAKILSGDDAFGNLVPWAGERELVNQAPKMKRKLFMKEIVDDCVGGLMTSILPKPPWSCFR